jgi:hypothetical protein
VASLLIAWLLICSGASLCVLRVRALLRRDVIASQFELVGTCVLAAAMVCGTAVPSLLACPRVYEEDLAWSIALALLLLATIVQYFSHPRKRTLAVIAIFTLAAVMTRGSTGDAWLIGLGLIAVFCRFSTHGQPWRSSAKWFFAICLTGGLAIVAVSYAKFGIVYGFDERDQVWTHVYAPRRAFLAANGNSTFGLQFLPTTLLAYLSPVGLWLSGLFPFFQPPNHPVNPVGKVVFDQIWPTPSLTASSLVLVVLAVIGTVALLVRPRTPETRVLRLLLTATVLATGPVFLFGYIAPRYLGDFVPWLVLGGASGFFILLNRLVTKQTVVLAGVVAMGALAIVVNLAMATTMQPSWTKAQAKNFTTWQASLSPQSLLTQVSWRDDLPLTASPGHIVVVKDCQGIYRTLGPVPDITLLLAEHSSWFPLAPTVGASSTFTVHVRKTPQRGDPEIVLFTRGRSRLVLRPVRDGVARLIIENPVSQIPPVPVVSPAFTLQRGHVGVVKVTVDPYLATTEIAGFNNVLPTSYAGSGVTTYPPVTSPWADVALDRPTTKSALCLKLQQLRH